MVLLGGPAVAQTASQVTPPSFRPNQGGGGGTVVFSGRPGLGTPAGAEKLSVRLSGVTVEGGRPELAEAQRALEAKLVGRRVPASEIFAAARDLEAAYSRAGLVLSRVVLPAQTLRDGGRLRLVVIEGFIERVEFRLTPDGLRARLSALIEPLVGKRGLALGEIERRLLLAGDTPGVALRSALSPGAQPGGTVLIVEAKYRPVTGFLGVDNTVANSLGRWVLSSGVDLNTVLGYGETFYIRALGHPTGDDATGFGSIAGERPRLRTVAGGLVIPLGLDGLTFNVEGTESRTTPRLPGFGQTSSTFDRLSFRLRYPWIRGRTYNLNSELTFDATSEDLRLLVPGFAVPLSLDRLRVIRLATDGDIKLETGALLAGRAILSFGIDALGARSARDATPLLPLSRLGADDDFKKLEAVVSIVQPISEHLAVSLIARAQTSFGQVLPRSEQIGIASFQELSTFDAGTLGGDSGWVVRGEISSPNTVPVGGRPASVTPYAFAATGALYLERPTIFEASRLQVTSVGVGVRLAAPLDDPLSQASLTMEFGRRFRDDALPDSNRFTMVGSIRF